ncbi:hypothetical protein [Fluviicola sp.]|uniref:hypothetical protein n=1 Tax=Fluviicola sp. TaxID=1917219 RepID=UPI003D2972B2
MKNQPIDDLSSIQNSLQKEDPVVKVVAVTLCLIVFVFSFLCFKDIVAIINHYFSYRFKFVIGFELHSISVAVSMLSIPLIAYNTWLRQFKTQGFVPYLILLIGTFVLVSAIYLSGLEIIFYFPKMGINSNPLLPSYAVFSPFHLYFDLLFFFSVGMSFLIMRLLFRKRKQTIYTNNK